MNNEACKKGDLADSVRIPVELIGHEADLGVCNRNFPGRNMRVNRRKRSPVTPAGPPFRTPYSYEAAAKYIVHLPEYLYV